MYVVRVHCIRRCCELSKFNRGLLEPELGNRTRYKCNGHCGHSDEAHTTSKTCKEYGCVPAPFFYAETALQGVPTNQGAYHFWNEHMWQSLDTPDKTIDKRQGHTELGQHQSSEAMREDFTYPDCTQGIDKGFCGSQISGVSRKSGSVSGNVTQPVLESVSEALGRGRSRR